MSGKDDLITRKELSQSLNEEIDGLKHDISSLNNEIINEEDVSKMVDIEIQGRTLVNLLGRRGNSLYQYQSSTNYGIVDYGEDSFLVSKVNSQYDFARLCLIENPTLEENEKVVCILGGRVGLGL